MSSDDPAAIYEAVLPPEEFEELVKRACADLDGEEGEDIEKLIAWYQRRYPTVIDRLRHATRKYREWTNAPKIPKDEIR